MRYLTLNNTSYAIQEFGQAQPPQNLSVCARQAQAAHWLWCGATPKGHPAAPHHNQDCCGGGNTAPTVQPVFAHRTKSLFPVIVAGKAGNDYWKEKIVGGHAALQTSRLAGDRVTRINNRTKVLL
jgi:hypothetical protein